MPSFRHHDDFHLLQSCNEFEHIAYSCSGSSISSSFCSRFRSGFRSRPLNSFSPPDVLGPFRALSSSVCSNTFNANILCLRDSAIGVIVARTARQPSSISFLSTKPFMDLSRVNVAAVNVFAPRSAQLSCDLTVLSVSVFALMTCCDRSDFQRFDFSDTLTSTDPTHCRTVHVK